jgi:hypothetical protein
MVQWSTLMVQDVMDQLAQDAMDLAGRMDNFAWWKRPFFWGRAKARVRLMASIREVAERAASRPISERGSWDGAVDQYIHDLGDNPSLPGMQGADVKTDQGQA